MVFLWFLYIFSNSGGVVFVIFVANIVIFAKIQSCSIQLRYKHIAMRSLVRDFAMFIHLRHAISL